MWVWECVGVGGKESVWVCGCGREREMLKSWERECVGVWVCEEREMLKSWERECVGMWVWEGKRNAES
jgi:hypothetical protein